MPTDGRRVILAFNEELAESPLFPGSFTVAVGGSRVQSTP